MHCLALDLELGRFDDVLARNGREIPFPDRPPPVDPSRKSQERRNKSAPSLAGLLHTARDEKRSAGEARLDSRLELASTFFQPNQTPRLSRPAAAGGMQSPGSGKRPNKGRVYGPAVLMLLIAAALACSRAMDDRDIERLQLAFLTGGSGLLVGYVLGRQG